jgi:hypothetical protein
MVCAVLVSAVDFCRRKWAEDGLLLVSLLKFLVFSGEKVHLYWNLGGYTLNCREGIYCGGGIYDTTKQ